MCLLARTHVPSSKNKNRESHFWPRVMTKNGLYHFYPSAKSRRELKIKTSGVIFQGASAYHVLKTIAPPKQAVCQFSDKHFCRSFLSKKYFQHPKMKCQGSSEMRFPKVWGPTEPSSWGKWPVRVLQHFDSNLVENFRHWCHHPGPRVSKLAKIIEKWQLWFCSIIRGSQMIR